MISLFSSWNLYGSPLLPSSRSATMRVDLLCCSALTSTLTRLGKLSCASWSGILFSSVRFAVGKPSAELGFPGDIANPMDDRPLDRSCSSFGLRVYTHDYSYENASCPVVPYPFPALTNDDFPLPMEFGRFFGNLEEDSLFSVLVVVYLSSPSILKKSRQHPHR